MAAIITDAHNLITLTVLRSLGRAGVDVTCLADGDRWHGSLTRYSRYGRVVRVPCLDSDPEGYWTHIRELSQPGTVLMPVLLRSVLAASRRLADGETGVTALLPPPGAVMEADSTDRLLAAAGEVGVPAPRTIILRAGQEPDPLRYGDVRFPVVVKYRQGDVLGLEAAQRYRVVDDPDQLAAVYRQMHAVQSYPLVQEYVDGPGYGMSALYDQVGRRVAVFCHRRLREYPVRGGPSTLAESVWEPELVDGGTRLLEHLRWRGVAMVEFKRDSASGQFKLMEINPRFWGSLPLPVMAGVDFPQLVYRLARGETVDPISSYRLGVRMRYLPKDLAAMWGLLRRARSGRGALALRMAADLLHLRTGDGLTPVRDPLPGMMYVVRALGKLGGGRR